MNDTFAKVTFEDGDYGLRAVIHGEFTEKLLSALRKRDIAEIELNQGKGWRGNDISFLSSFPNLKSFAILNLNIQNISPIHCLHDLRRLVVITYCKTPIDFGAFPHLERCELQWRPKAASIFSRTTLTSLFVDHFRGNDTQPFQTLVNLESLTLLNAPITNLHGLSRLSKLRKLRLGRLRKLESLAGIEWLLNLEVLEVDTCRAIAKIDEVASLSKLRTLHISNNGDIDSLKPLGNLSELRWLTFVESTNIVDGNLGLIFQKNLSRVSFQNRKHYTHRREEFTGYTAPSI